MSWRELFAAWLFIAAAEIDCVLSQLNALPCRNCGCKHTLSRNEVYLDNHTLCEYQVVCAGCKEVVNHWAYGSFVLPTTYTELVGMKVALLRYNLSRVFK